MKVRTEERREAILEVALQVFLEMGYERASMSEIVKRIGGSKSTIYGYFPSKEVLFLAVAHTAGERHMAASISALKAYDGKDLRTTLRSFAASLMALLNSPEAIAAQRMVLGEAGNSDIGTMFYTTGPERGLCAVTELLRVAIQCGQLREEDPRTMAQYFGSIVHAETQHRWFLKELAPIADAAIQEMAERAVDVFIRAFASTASQGNQVASHTEEQAEA